MDHLATPRMVADESQKTVWRWDNQEPFGNNPANEDPDGDGIAFDLPLRLPGQYYDRETGLHYNYFRDYDPSVGRYVESDPVGLAGGLNTFSYAVSHPLLALDVYGLAVRGEWINDSPRVQSWLPLPSNVSISLIQPDVDEFLFINFARVSAQLSSTLVIDVQCYEDFECGTYRWQVHGGIPISVYGHVDWGPNAIALASMVLTRNAKLTAAVNIALVLARTGKAAFSLYSKYGRIALMAYNAVLAYGPTQICTSGLPNLNWSYAN